MSARLLTGPCLAAVMAGLLVACAPHPPQPAERSQVAADFPDAYYRQIESRGARVLRVDPGRSLVLVEVRRGGALARLGHDHVVACRQLRGYVAVDEGQADIDVPLDGLTVDEPGLRADAGFEAVAPDVAAGTRHNMLEKVLEAARFPFARIHITGEGTAATTLTVTITLHGTTRSFSVPARIESQGDEMTVSGRMAFRQSDFGITPLAILGGALRVEDDLALRFRIVAARG